MTITESEIAALHEAYCKLTDQPGYPLRFNRQHNWYHWCQCGFTLDDLKLVIRYLKRGISNGKRNPGALKFSNLICQPDRFEDDLFEARRVLNVRKPRPTLVEKEIRAGDLRILAEVPAPDATVNVGDIFKQIRQALPEN